MAAGATETPALLRRSGLGRHPQLGRVEHLATLGAMIADAPSGRVIGARRVMVRYDLTRSDAGRLVRAITAMGRILFAAGATAVVTGIRGYETVRNQTELAEAAAHGRRERLHVAAFHPTGTARMGADDQRHPVDGAGRLRGVRGMWLADASVLPTCPEVKPQMTIMAMAQSVARSIST